MWINRLAISRIHTLWGLSFWWSQTEVRPSIARPSDLREASEQRRAADWWSGGDLAIRCRHDTPGMYLNLLSDRCRLRPLLMRFNCYSLEALLRDIICQGWGRWLSVTVDADWCWTKRNGNNKRFFTSRCSQRKKSIKNKEVLILFFSYHLKLSLG